MPLSFFLLLGASAGAAELVSPAAPAALDGYTRWIARAATPAPPGPIRVLFAACPAAEAAACTVHGPTPEIYVGRRGTDRLTFLHEIGHVFDAQVLTDADRAAIGALLAPGRAWRAPPNSPHERFAEAYARCATAPAARRTWRGAYGYVATAARHHRVCELIRAAGQRPRP